MYDREYDDRVLRFEASGGLLHSSLVLQDKETDSYWSLMEGHAIAGELFETRLKELPVGQKVIWRDWFEMYPNTLVLSVNGREDTPVDPYQDYYESNQSFGNRVARDKRLATKEPIFAFFLDGDSYVVPLKRIEGGAAFSVGDRHLFLFRPISSPVLRSTIAYSSSSGGFVLVEGEWRHLSSFSAFDETAGVFGGSPVGLKRMEGFDTYWYTWSPQNPGSRILNP